MKHGLPGIGTEPEIRALVDRMEKRGLLSRTKLLSEAAAEIMERRLRSVAYRKGDGGK